MGCSCNRQRVVWAFIVIVLLSSLWFIWNNCICKIPAHFMSTASNIRKLPLPMECSTVSHSSRKAIFCHKMLVMSQTFYCCGPCSLVTVGGWSLVTWPQQKLVCLPRIQLWLLHFQWNPQTELPGITLGHFLNVLIWHYNIMGIVVTKSADVARSDVLLFCFRFSKWN